MGADPSNKQAYRTEARQLRNNYDEYCRQMQDLVALFDVILPDPKTVKDSPAHTLACLALHHFAMRFRSHAGPTARQIMLSGAASVDDLPPSFGRF